MSYQIEAARVQMLLTKYRFERCSIGGVQFLINPSSINFPDEHLISEVPTAAGYGRYWWGQKPRQYSLEGTVGMYGTEHLKQMDAFRPIFGSSDRKFEFRFPFRFTGIRPVFINRMEDRLSSQFPSMIFYHIDMTEYAPPVPTITKNGPGYYTAIVGSTPSVLR